MRKIIAIGESILDTVYRDHKPVRSFVGGRVSNAAAALGDVGLPVSMVSECCADMVGDWVVDFFKSHNVDTKSIDRYTDGSTPMAAIFENDGAPDTIVNYGVYPRERFSVIWPRIDEDDVILFGSYYAIDRPQHERLNDLLTYAADRKAILVYLPGFQHGTPFNLTMVMPNILDNLEVSSIVVDHDKDINVLFPNQDSDKVYNNHIKFYGPTYVHINPGSNATIYKGSEKTEFPFNFSTGNLLGWQSGFVAGLIYGIFEQNIRRMDIDTLTTDKWNALMQHAFEFAASSAASQNNTLDARFIASHAKLNP